MRGEMDEPIVATLKSLDRSGVLSPRQRIDFFDFPKVALISKAFFDRLEGTRSVLFKVGVTRRSDTVVGTLAIVLVPFMEENGESEILVKALFFTPGFRQMLKVQSP